MNVMVGFYPMNYEAQSPVHYQVVLSPDGIHISQAKNRAVHGNNTVLVDDVSFSAGNYQLNYGHLHGAFDGDSFFLPINEISMLYEAKTSGVPILYLFTRMGTFGLAFPEGNRDVLCTLKNTLTAQ